jgi:hypothetical protein
LRRGAVPVVIDGGPNNVVVVLNKRLFIFERIDSCRPSYEAPAGPPPSELDGAR